MSTIIVFPAAEAELFCFSLVSVNEPVNPIINKTNVKYITKTPRIDRFKNYFPPITRLLFSYFKYFLNIIVIDEDKKYLVE